jgi:hypothetical protein
MAGRERLKWFLVVVAGLLLLAFFTNPTQARHLKAIRETGALRQSAGARIDDLLLPTVEYHNYWLFSTTTWVDAHLTYGYFGIVQTTDNIGILYGSGRPPK